ncbi:hypothetical protein HGRIS_007595 [Hohenbuehelia grisea]|uniref:Uncharacterized protein n=1 Tax=Hohenbuehelia grisea TaxID=104357 RepID=A0ABR3J5C7_9AGAR
MPALTYEQKKQRYSQELAAHTLKQWNAARESMEHARTSKASTTVSVSPQRSDASTPEKHSRDTSSPRTPRNGLQVIDYGLTSSKHASGDQRKEHSRSTHH